MKRMEGLRVDSLAGDSFAEAGGIDVVAIREVSKSGMVA